MLLSQLLWTEEVSSETTFTDVPFLTLKLSIIPCKNICWRGPGLALWAQADREKLLTSPPSHTQSWERCQALLSDLILSEIQELYKWNSSLGGDALYWRPCSSCLPLPLCLLLCKHFPVLVFQVASWSGADSPLSAFSFFTIPLFYTNNRLLCCCPLNLENKDPTPQMPAAGGGMLFTNSLGSQTTPLSLSRGCRPWVLLLWGWFSAWFTELLECKVVLSTPELVCNFFLYYF